MTYIYSMNLVDSHSHLYLEEFSQDLPQVMERARQAGVSHIFMPNIDCSTVKSMLDVCNKYRGVCYPMVGLHPTSVSGNFRDELDILKHLLDARRDFVGIGEVGMDLYWDKTFVNEQREALEIQIKWALEYDLPLVIHCREAFSYVYELLQKYKSNSLRGVFHSFTGTQEEAAMLLEFPGFFIGINGIVTFNKSLLPQILSSIPLERILLETDAPYLAPVPYRGRRNESAYLIGTLQKVSEVYVRLPEEVAQITSENALNLFGKP